MKPLRIVSTTGLPDDRRSVLTPEALPLAYMADFSVLGLAVDHLEATRRVRGPQLPVHIRWVRHTAAGS